MLGILSLSVFMEGCASAYLKMVGADTGLVYSKIFVGDFELIKKQVYEALKTTPNTEDQEHYTFQTKWVDNTVQLNELHSDGGVTPYVKAQYRFLVSLAKGFLDGKPSVKVSVQKEQQYQRDVLEGWKNIESDGIAEKSFLYRVGQLIKYATRLENEKNQKLRQQLRNAEDSP